LRVAFRGRRARSRQEMADSAAPAFKPVPLPHDSTVAPGFHVPYAARESPFGLGLFAVCDIPAGTLLWKYSAAPGGNVLSFRTEAEARERLRALATHEERVFWMDHVYMFDGKLNEILDDGKLWNHSAEPCTGLPPAGDGYDIESSYAVRDIKAGEQLLDDYGTYEYPEWYERLCAEFGVSREFVEKREEKPALPERIVVAAPPQ